MNYQPQTVQSTPRLQQEKEKEMKKVRFTLTCLVTLVLLLLAACSQTSQPSPGASLPELPGSFPRADTEDTLLSPQADVVIEQLDASFRTCGDFSHFGQTFTATATGEITSIALAPNSNIGTFTTTLRVLKRDRTTVLHSQSVNLSDSGGALVTIPLSTPLPVINGEGYAFDIGVGCANFAGAYSSFRDPYALGIAYSESRLYIFGDLAFRITIAPDIVPPSVTLEQASGQADPTSVSPIMFTAEFSEAVTGFDGSDVTLSGTAGATTAVVSGGPKTYTIAVSGMTSSGTVIASIPEGAARDLGRNPNAASTSSDNTVTYVVLDTTPPVITPTVLGTLGNNGWYTSDVTVSWSVVDDESTISSQTGCETQNVTTDTAGVTFTCEATSAGGTASQSVTIKRDATAPTIALASRTPANGAGWNNSDVTVAWNCTDTTSGAVNASVSQTLSSEGANQSSTGTCMDNAGLSASDTQNGINIDKTAPSLSPSVSPNPVVLGSSASATPNVSDALSGVASASCDSVDTNSVGTKSVSCSATDNAGNSASANASYQVIYNFSGFFSPVDNLPTVNQVKAGSAIPVKFSLGGNQGLNILAAGSPSSQTINCSSSAPVDDIEETVTAGGSSLSYDASTDTYSYVWKTNKAWAGTCRQLIVTLSDGTQHLANFKFK